MNLPKLTTSMFQVPKNHILSKRTAKTQIKSFKLQRNPKKLINPKRRSKRGGREE